MTRTITGLPEQLGAPCHLLTAAVVAPQFVLPVLSVPMSPAP